MLRIYPVVLELVGMLQPLVIIIARRDRDLARQLLRCSSSIALNMAEGMYSRGGNRESRYHTALGSARETLACLEVAQERRYTTTPPAIHATLNRIIGTLVRLVR